MNRVRIVALAAVGLGVAVTVGTQFQQQAAEPQLAEAAQPTAEAVQAVAAAEPAAAPAPQQPSLAPQGARQLAGTAPLPAMPGNAGAAPAAPMITGDMVAGLPPEVAATIREEAARAQRPAPGTNSLIPASSIAPIAPASIVPQTDLGASPEAMVRPAQAGLLEPRGSQPQTPAFPPAAQALDQPAQPAAPLDEEMQAEIDNCAVWVVVTPAPGAMLDMSVYAPCDQGEEVTVTHAGLTFDARVGADGQLMGMVPALSEDATVSIAFADGRMQSDTTFVPDLAAHERVALQWQGPATLMLHAYEFGAHYGDPGHLHAGHPLAPGVTNHGFITVLGDPEIADGHRAQVYSYPTSASQRRGSVTLEIEAPVTDASCGQPLNAQAIELRDGATVDQRTIHVEMPSCDGQGGYVVLPGVLPDLQIAMN